MDARRSGVGSSPRQSVPEHTEAPLGMRGHVLVGGVDAVCPVSNVIIPLGFSDVKEDWRSEKVTLREVLDESLVLG